MNSNNWQSGKTGTLFRNDSRERPTPLTISRPYSCDRNRVCMPVHVAGNTEALPSGKASDFDSDIRWFKSSRFCQPFGARVNVRQPGETGIPRWAQTAGYGGRGCAGKTLAPRWFKPISPPPGRKAQQRKPDKPIARSLIKQARFDPASIKIYLFRLRLCQECLRSPWPKKVCGDNRWWGGTIPSGKR